MKIRAKRFLLIPSLCLVLFIASGCASLTPSQKAAGLQFGNAASVLGTLTAAEFMKSRQAVVEMRTMMSELGSPDVYTGGVFDPDGPMDVDDVEARVKASRTLAKYGEVLINLIESSQTEKIKASTDDLLANLDDVGVSMSDESKGTIGGIVGSITGMFIEANRKKAVLEVIPRMKNPVNAILDEMEQSFSRNDVNWSAAFTETTGDLRNIRTDLGQTVTEAQSNKAKALADTKRNRFDKVTNEINKSIDLAREAHEDLIDSLENEKRSLDSLNQFVVQIERLKGFYAILEND